MNQTTTARTSSMASTAHDQVDRIDGVANAVKDVTHAGIDKVEQAAASVQSAAKQATVAAKAATDKLAACIEERPFTSVVIALGVGALVGVLLGRSRSPR